MYGVWSNFARASFKSVQQTVSFGKGICYSLIAAGSISSVAHAQALPSDDGAWAHAIIKDALEGNRFPIPAALGYPAGSTGTNFYSGSGCTSVVTENYPPLGEKPAKVRTINFDWRKGEAHPGANGYWRFISSDWLEPEYFYVDQDFSPSYAAVLKLLEICQPASLEGLMPEHGPLQNAVKALWQQARPPLTIAGTQITERGTYRVMGTGCRTFIWTAIPAVTHAGKQHPASRKWYFADWGKTVIRYKSTNPEYIFLGSPEKSFLFGTAAEAARVKVELDKLVAACGGKVETGQRLVTDAFVNFNIDLPPNWSERSNMSGTPVERAETTSGRREVKNLRWEYSRSDLFKDCYVGGEGPGAREFGAEYISIEVRKGRIFVGLRENEFFDWKRKRATQIDFWAGGVSGPPDYSGVAGIKYIGSEIWADIGANLVLKALKDNGFTIRIPELGVENVYKIELNDSDRSAAIQCSARY